MPSETLKKALKDGLLTQKQYDKLPEKLLEGIVKSKRKGTKKGGARKDKPKGSRLAFDDTKQSKKKKGKKGKK